MKWASPWAWAFLLPLVVVFFGSYFEPKNKKRGTLRFSSNLVLSKVKPSLRVQLAFLPHFLKFLSLGLAIVALARPQVSNSKVNRSVEGIDIMMALDVSDSMEIEDMEPNNRMAAAKSVVKNFIKGRVNDRIGLVIFAGESYTRCPLTLDYNVLLESLAAVSPDSIKQGTAIGVALANSVARLKDSTAKSRVVILLTDGENNSGTIDPATATEIAKGYGIKVYTIGIGRDGQTRMPVYTVDAFGRKIKTYQPIHSTVNMTLLDSMAASTGGKSYRAIDTEALKQVFKEIDSLEKSKISTQQYVKFTEVFSPWLLAATILFLMQFFLDRSLLRRLP